MVAHRKLKNSFTYLESSISSTEFDISMSLAKARTATNRLSIIWKSNQFDKIKMQFLPSCNYASSTVWIHHTDADETQWGDLDGTAQECNELYWTNPGGSIAATSQQLFGHLPPISKTFQIKRTRHAGHCWRRKDALISDVLLWTLSHGRASVNRSARSYLEQLCTDTICSLEDLPEAMNDREEWFWESRRNSC